MYYNHTCFRFWGSIGFWAIATASHTGWIWQIFGQRRVALGKETQDLGTGWHWIQWLHMFGYVWIWMMICLYGFIWWNMVAWNEWSNYPFQFSQKSQSLEFHCSVFATVNWLHGIHRLRWSCTIDEHVVTFQTPKLYDDVWWCMMQIEASQVTKCIQMFILTPLAYHLLWMDFSCQHAEIWALKVWPTTKLDQHVWVWLWVK